MASQKKKYKDIKQATFHLVLYLHKLFLYELKLF